MPLGSAAMALTLKSTSSAVEAERTGSDPIRNCIFVNVAHESCVLIKLLLRLLHCRKPGLAFVAFDMSRQRLMWFARACRLKNKCAFGRTHAADASRGDCRMWRRAGIPDEVAGPCPDRLSQPSHQVDCALSAGGTTDFLGRLVADQLKTGLGATVIVENKPGAATALGAEQVARAEPDGYTLLMATSTTLAINKTLYKKLPYDPVKDFTPIALVAAVPFALIINPSIPAKTLPEFIAYAKSKPGLAYGSAGNGSPQHLGAEMLRAAAGIDIRHVPYRGSVPAMLDVIAGHIPFMVVDLQPALQQIREGKVRVLGVTSAKRVAAAPDIPTLAEGGLAGFELVAWQGVVAPAGVPGAIVDQLAAQIRKLVADPATRDKLTTISLEPLPGSTPDSFAAYVKTEVDRWADIVKNSGAELE
jgi:tripartite-type tricarboxylate transporter receptor subunit TctC